MSVVVENLILRSRLPYRQVCFLAVLFRHHLLGKIEDTGVTAFGNLILQLKLEVLELRSEDKVTAALNLSLARTGAFQLDCAVLDSPALGRRVHAIAAPAVESLAVEENDISVLVDRELGDVDVFIVNNPVIEFCLVCRFVLVACAAGA